MSAAVEFQGVSHTYRSKGKAVQALRDVSFSLDEGEVFGFVGPNGAGKSTTIKIMLDIINDYQGKVTLYGTDAHQAEARRGMAYVPEAPALYDQFTPLEILRMGLSMYGIKRNDADTWCQQWLERFSVDGTGKRRMRELSKGTAQRVALAHAMAVEPRLLILDEPLSGLDPVGRKDVVDILNDYKKQGGAIFFTSHVLHDVERIADRFGFINKGQLVTVRSPANWPPNAPTVLSCVTRRSSHWGKAASHCAPASSSANYPRPNSPLPSPSSVIPGASADHQTCGIAGKRVLPHSCRSIVNR